MTQLDTATLRSAAASLCAIASLLGLLAACGATPESEDSVDVVSSKLDVSKFGGWKPAITATGSGAPAANFRGIHNDTLDLFQLDLSNNLSVNTGQTTNDGVSWNWSSSVFTGLGAPPHGLFGDSPASTGWVVNRSFGSAVAERSIGSGLRQVFVRFSSAVGVFTPWAQVSTGDLEQDPAMAFGNTTLYVFAPGTLHTFYFSKNDINNGYNAANWTSWQEIPGGNLNTAGGAAAIGTNLFLAARATDNKFYLNKSTNGGASWSGWNQILLGSANTFAYAPALTATVTTSGAIELDVFGTAMSSNGVKLVLNSTSLDGGTSWSPYQSTGIGNLIEAPAAAVTNGPDSTRRFETFGRGTDNKIYQNTYRQ